VQTKTTMQLKIQQFIRLKLTRGCP